MLSGRHKDAVLSYEDALRERERRAATGSGDGDAISSGLGYNGNKEGGSPNGTQGSSKLAKVDGDRGSQGDASSDRASGSAGPADGGGRADTDLADVAFQLIANQRKVVRRFEARLARAVAADGGERSLPVCQAADPR